MILKYTNNAKADFDMCSFCGRSKSEVTVLITGADASICEHCIVQANTTLLKDAGFTDSFYTQFLTIFQKINKRLILILVLISVAFTIIITSTIFSG